MGYGKKFREKCLEMFIAGYNLQHISDMFDKHPSRVTLSKWKHQYGWIEKKKLASESAFKEINENLTGIKLRQLKVAKAGQEDYMKKIKIEPGTTTYGEASKAIRDERLILGEATERIEGTGFPDLHKVYEKCKSRKKKKSGTSGSKKKTSGQ